MSTFEEIKDEVAPIMDEAMKSILEDESKFDRNNPEETKKKVIEAVLNALVQKFGEEIKFSCECMIFKKPQKKLDLKVHNEFKKKMPEICSIVKFEDYGHLVIVSAYEAKK